MDKNRPPDETPPPDDPNQPKSIDEPKDDDTFVLDDRCVDDWVLAANMQAAERGIPEAQNEMGIRSYVGDLVEKSRAAALDWFGKAAAQGNADACYNLGICHAYGWRDRPKEAFLGVKCNRLENGSIAYGFSPPRRWIKRLAEDGDVESQYEMGLEMSLFSSMWQKEKESRAAVSWFLKAAEQGHAEAENELGECYRDGHGVERDMSEAVRWFEIAAEQNNPKALFNLGFHYHAGNGVRRDWKKAKKLLERAVEMDKDGWRAGDKAKECLRNMGCLP